MRRYLKRFLKDKRAFSAIELAGVVAVGAILIGAGVVLAQNVLQGGSEATSAAGGAVEAAVGKTATDGTRGDIKNLNDCLAKKGKSC